MKSILTILFILFLTGCTKEKYFVCEIDLYNEIQEYELTAQYKVYYDNSYVTKIEKKEAYITDDKETLNYFNEYKSLEYMNLNNLYGGTIYTVSLKENKVILNATINMEEVDIKKMIKNKYIDKDYIVSNKLTTGGIKNIYKEKGAICDI